MKLNVDEEGEVASDAASRAQPTSKNKRDMGGVVKIVSQDWSVERAMNVVGRGLGSSMKLAAASDVSTQLEKPSAQEVQEACAYLCMMCWEQNPPEDAHTELPDLSTEIDVHMRKKKRTSEGSVTAPPSVPSGTAKFARSPQSFHAAPAGNGGRDSRNFSSSASDPTPTPLPQMPLVEVSEVITPPRALVCPVCTGPGRNPTDSHCQGCYTTLWKDARRVATNALDRATPDRWLVGERAGDLERFLVEIQVVGKRCLTGSLNCDPSFFSHTRTNKCTRCRSKAAIRLLPALAHRQLCAAFKEIALELGLNDEPLVAVPPLPVPRGRPAGLATPPPLYAQPPSSTLVPTRPPQRVSSPAPGAAAAAAAAATSSAAAAAAVLIAAATAAPRRARAVASVTVTAAANPSSVMPAPGAAAVGPHATPPLPPYPFVHVHSSSSHHAAMSAPAMLMHAGHMGSTSAGMSPAHVTLASMGGPSPYPYPSFSPFGLAQYWVDAHGVAHALTPGFHPGAGAPSPSPTSSLSLPPTPLPQGFVYPPGGMAWAAPSSSSLR